MPERKYTPSWSRSMPHGAGGNKMDSSPPPAAAESTALSGNVVRLKPNKRYADRLEQGMQVAWRGQSLQLANWSLGGLGVIDPSSSWTAGQEVKLLLQVPLPECHFPLNVRALVTHFNSDTGYIGLQFRPLDSATYNALVYLFRQHTRGNTVSLSGLMTAYHRRTTTPQQEEEEGEDTLPNTLPLSRLQQGFKQGLVYLAVAGLAMTMIYLLAGTFNRHFFEIAAPYASVTSAAHTLKAPSSGWTMAGKVSLDAGSVVKKGTPILTLENPALETEITAAEAQITLQDQHIALYEHRLKLQRQGWQLYEELAENRTVQAEADLTAARSLLAERNQTFKRIKALQAKGFASKQQLEAVQTAAKQAEASVTAAKAARDAANTNTVMAKKTFFSSGNRLEEGTPHLLQEKIARARAVKDTLKSQLNSLRRQQAALTLKSPCNCLVEQQLQTVGTWVKAGEPLLTLVPKSSRALRLEARIPQEEASRLRIGSRAFVTLANEKSTRTAYVTQIQRTSSTEPRLGLPIQAANEKWASVVVALQTPLPETATVGLPVEMVFDVSYRNPLVQAYQWTINNFKKYFI